MVFTSKNIRLITSLTVAVLLSSSQTFASDADECKAVRFSDVGWTDVTSTTAVARTVLEAIGYDTNVKILSVPVTYASLANNDIDVFLGNWMPTMEADIAPYLEAGTVDTVATNLTGAKYTLAVPKYTYDKGLKDFSDIDDYSKDLSGDIYGIEAGNDGNRLILKMISDNEFGLKDFDLVESSEAGMLSQVARAVRRNEDIVFLGWAPHPMNSNFQIEYLSGGDDVFGPDFGGAIVRTNTRAGYSQECPNMGNLLTNMTFSLDMENEIMSTILNDNAEPDAAAKAWIKEHPEVLNTWLSGVTTFDGQDALQAAQENLGS